MDTLLSWAYIFTIDILLLPLLLGLLCGFRLIYALNSIRLSLLFQECIIQL